MLTGVLLLPSALPLILGWARRVTGKDLIDVTIPHRAVYLAIVANIVAWLLYGAAFELFVLGMTGSAPGSYAGLRHHLGLVVPGSVILPSSFRAGSAFAKWRWPWRSIR